MSDAYFTDARPGFRSGFVALVGRPNVGKSTLVNCLVGQKVAITADKPQTTRHRITGVLTQDHFQLVLLDVPGFQRPRDELTQRMQETVEQTLGEVDAVLFLTAADEQVGAGDRFIASTLAGVETPVVAAVNKIDVVGPGVLLPHLQAVADLGDYHAIHPVSARTGEGVADLLADLAGLLPEGPLYFPPGLVTDQQEEHLVAELIREKAIWATQEELPHAIAVQVLEMEPREGQDLVYIRAAVYVERASQRAIVLGDGGARLREIGTAARREIEELLGVRVYLDLHVKVRKHWRQDPRMLDGLGL